MQVCSVSYDDEREWLQASDDGHIIPQMISLDKHYTIIACTTYAGYAILTHYNIYIIHISNIHIGIALIIVSIIRGWRH